MIDILPKERYNLNGLKVTHSNYTTNRGITQVYFVCEMLCVERG